MRYLRMVVSGTMIVIMVMKMVSDEMLQNENEETEGRERKGNRPGVLRCGYCVKQGNVVSTHSS